jgi:A/G-specific adenine glycosylase
MAALLMLVVLGGYGWVRCAIGCGRIPPSVMSPGQGKNKARLREPEFGEKLLRWYHVHARDLPWRARPGAKPSGNAYPVWVSEIMLQQTRVAAVIGHYHEFLRRFPTVEKLAAAREASVLAAWSGLGYYRRARMLHAAAKVVARELGGTFPISVEGWRALPGVGRYTASAIASISCGEPVAVVDGNVERVLQRVWGKKLAGERLWATADGLLNRERPGDFNQAMMELGATVCTPRVPACLTCPVVELCATRGEMAGGAKAARQKKREIHYALDVADRAVLLVQRPRDARLMAGMWELPEIPSGAKAPANGAGETAALKALRHPKESSAGTREQGPRVRQKQVPPARFASRRNDETSRNGRAAAMIPEPCLTLKHSITVTDYTVRVWRMPAPNEVRGKWVPVNELARVALTGVARKILAKVGLLKNARGFQARMV